MEREPDRNETLHLRIRVLRADGGWKVVGMLHYHSIFAHTLFQGSFAEVMEFLDGLKRDWY